MLIAYSIAYAPKSSKDTFYEMGNYAILFYFSHVVTIIIVANLVFWLKDIDPRFRDGEDASFDDIPSLVEHKKRLEESGQNAELQKAAFFVNHIKGDVKDFAIDVKDRASGLVNIVTGGLIGQHRERGSGGKDGQPFRRSRAQSGSSNYSNENIDSRRNSIDETSQRNAISTQSNTIIANQVGNQGNGSGNGGEMKYFNNTTNSSNVNVPLSVIAEEGDDDSMVHNPVHKVQLSTNDHFV